MDINCDMGEMSETWYSGHDKDILKYITSINISCGAHAGDEALIIDTIKEAVKYKLKLGAHPSFPDPENFGRVVMEISSEDLRQTLFHQILYLKGIVEKEGEKLHHLKLHGALYNQAAQDIGVASVLLNVVTEIDKKLIIYCPFDSNLEKEAKKVGLTVCREAFADRTYNNDGSLVNRSDPRALILDPLLALEQAKEIWNFKRVKSLGGEIITLEANTICVHGDGLKALEIASSLSNYFFKK